MGAQPPWPPSHTPAGPAGSPDTYWLSPGFFLSLLAKKCPRIMKKSIYSSDIQSGAFWNELATGEFVYVCVCVFPIRAPCSRWERGVAGAVLKLPEMRGPPREPPAQRL